MADRRLLAAFFLSAPARPPDEAFAPLLRATAVEVVRTAPWSSQDTPWVLGRWGGLDCEAYLLSLAYYDVLVVTFRQDDFRALTRDVDQRQGLADSFVTACLATSPVSALVTAYAWVDPNAYLAELEDRVLGGQVPGLAREHIWLLYVPADDADLLTTHRPESAEVVAVDGGAVLYRELDLADG